VTFGAAQTNTSSSRSTTTAAPPAAIRTFGSWIRSCFDVVESHCSNRSGRWVRTPSSSQSKPITPGRDCRGMGKGTGCWPHGGGHSSSVIPSTVRHMTMNTTSVIHRGACR
jgi:hypothetical protein